LTPPGPDEQISTHLAKLEATPGDEGAFQALEAIYQKYDRWEDLVALYEGRARAGAEGGPGGLLAKAAELAHRRMRNTARAEELYRQVLHADPKHADALGSMVEIYEERGDFAAVAVALERQADQTTDPRAAARLYLRLGRVHEERLLRRDRATLYYGRASRMAPDLAEPRTAELRCQLALRRFSQAKRALDQARERGGDARALAAEYARLGTLLVDEPLDHGLAMDALIDALALDRAAPGAAAALEKLKSAARTWRADVRALLDEAMRARERRTAAQLYLRAAGLHAAYDPDGGPKVLELAERALLLAPAAAQPLELLERFLSERQDWRGLSEALRRLTESVRDRAALSGIHQRLARIDLVHFGDPQLAIASLERALTLEPASEPAAQQALELYLEAGQQAQALALLERHLAAAPERPHHVPLRLRAAELATALGDEARARTHLEAARRLDPRSPPVAAALAPILEHAGEWRALTEALEAQAQAEADPAARSRLMERAAEVELSHLGAPRDAMRRLAQALRLDPGRAALRKAIDAAAVRADLFLELARAYRAAADAPAADARARKVLLRRAAEVWDRDLGQPEQAIEAWQELVALDPQDAGARASLDACRVRAGRLEEVAEDLRRRIAAASGPERAELLVKLARCHEEAGDPDGAARAWRDVVAGGDETAGALRGLADALGALGPSRAEERLDVLARLAARLSGSERAAVDLERAALLQEPLGRRDAAAAVLLEVVRAGGISSGQLAEAAAGLEALLARGVEPVRIAQALAPVYAAQREPGRHVAMLELLAQRLPEGADPRERARLLLDAAAVRSERLSDPRGALSAASAALRACPDHPEARATCERLAQAVGAFSELYALFSAVADRLEGRPEEERALRARAAQIAEEELGNAEEAAAQLRRCLALLPGDSSMLAALTRIALGAERWEESCELLRERTTLAQGPERVALLAQLGDTLLEHREDASAATDAYRQALDAAAPEARPRLLARLAAALEKAGDADGQARVLAELSRASSDPAEAAEAARRRARLLAGRLGDPAGAVEHFGAALLGRPEDAEARSALEQLAASTDPAVARGAATALLAAAERTGEPRRLLAALETIAAVAADPAGRAEAERRAAQVWGESLGQWSLAFAALQRALRVRPGDGALRRELRDAAVRAGAAADGAAVYEALLPELSGGEAVAAARELAALYEEQLRDPARAARALAEVVRLAPGDGDALASLRRLHRAAGRGEELLAVCLALAERSASDAARADAWREAAQVAEERLGDLARAVDLWSKVAALAPDDADADAALERLLGRLDRPEALAALLERRRARPGRERDLELAFRLAELRRTRLAAPADALALLGAVLRADPTHEAGRAALIELAAVPGPVGREALVMADALLRALGEHAARALARERRLHAVDDPLERARLHAEIRGVHERDVGEPRLAFAAAARAYGEGGPARAEAEPELVRLADATGLHEQLAEAYEAVAAVEQGDAADALRRRAARLREEKVADPRGAIAAWTAIAEARPSDPDALAALQRLYTRAREAQKLAEVARRRAAMAEGPDRAAQLVALAELEEGLGEEGAAAAAAEEALLADPRSATALDVLARLYRRAGRALDLASVLCAQADLARDDAVRRLELLCERGRLLEEAGESAAALDAYAEVLAEHRQDPRALEGLERLARRPEARDAAARMLEDVLRGQGDARRLVALLATRLETADAAERAPLLAEIAVLHERLGERTEAFRARARALRETVPAGTDDPSLRADLERLAAASGAHAELAQSYEELLAHGLPAPGRGEVLRRLAGVYADQLDRPADAARALEALAGDAPDPAILAALARLYRRLGAPRELARALGRQAGLAPSAEAKKELLLEVATIMEEHLSDREGAIDAYRQILSVDPEDPNALRLLGRLLGGAERWDELVEVLGREVTVAERRPNLVAEAAELRFRLGRIRHQRLADVAGALQCYRGVLEKVPRHPAAVAALAELARASGPGAIEAATLLEPIYEQEGEWAKLVEVLAARAAALPDAPARAALYRRVAEVQAAALRSPELGFLTAARALREDPDAPESIALAARLADAASLHDELATLLAEIADRLRDPAARVELRRRIAALAARADDPRRAAEAWTRVLELAPDDGEALSGLAAALRAAGDADGLAGVLRRRAAVEETPAVRAAVLAELAQLQEERQKDLPGAIGTLRRLLELEPSRRDALSRLDRLCVQTEKWVELADVLAREAAAAQAAGDAGATAAFRQRLAELRETRLLDREGALALYEEILAARPDDAQALARLEALLQRDPSHVRAAAALERAYAATGAWPRYAAVLELRAGERPDPVERKALFLELADIQEKRLGNAELAFVAYCRAFRDDPADPALRAELERLAAATEHAEELAAIYEDEFERLPPSPAAEVALTLGTLHEEKLQGPAVAAGWLEKARRLDPAAAPRALSGLDRLYRQGGRHAELADVLEAEAALAGADERTTFLFRLGQLCDEQLRDQGRATRAYEALVAEDPRQIAALRALERLYEAEGRLEALAENLASQRDLVADAPTRLRLTARLAAVTQTLGRQEQAMDLWREALGLDPRHEPALAALEGLYESLERWPELAEHLRVRLALTADRREAARLHDKLGALLGTRLGDAAEAVRAYQAVLDADPRNRKALEALRELYAAQGDAEGLASIYRRLIPLQEDAAGVKAIRMKLAEVLLEAGKRGEAAEQGRRALELEPHGEADLGRLAAIFEGAGAPQDRVKAVEARAALLAAAGRVDEAVEAWLAAAEAWERPLAKAEQAAAALEKVLELGPGRRDAWSRLRELYARGGNWRAYVRVCDHFTGQIEDRAERLQLLRDVAQVHEQRLGQRDMAFLTWCRAFSEAPTDAEAVSAVQRLAAETQAFDELAAVYEQVAEDAKGVPKARLLIDLGRLRDARLDDADAAEAAFRRALEVDPASPEALDALTELFTRRGRVRDLVIALEQKLEAAAGLDEKKATLLEMARIYDGQLHDAAEAIAALKRVLELDGADAAALEALASLYRREARWGDLAGILARARDLAQDEASRVSCQLQVAGLHENELADDEAAVEAYRAVLGLDDRHPDALAGLERLYTKLDRFAELNRVYEKQAEIATDPREQVRALAKSASIWEEKLGNPHKAIERNEAVLSLDGSNLAAVKNLEALYRRECQWEKLIAVLTHHCGLTQDRRELVSLEVQVGEVWWKELARVDRAEAMFSHALQIEPESREAVSALARLYERSGNWNLALEMLQREAKLAATPADVVAIHARIGRIQEEMLQDRAAARVAYGRALDVDPGHVPSLRALRAIAEGERDREAYLRLLLAEARYTEDDLGRAKLHHEAGRIHQEERDDPDGAARLYEEALRRVPDFLPAARPLADLYVARADWPRAEAVLDVVVRRLAQDGEPKELCRQSYRLGYVAEKLGNRDKALECYRRAYELDATYLPALEGLGHLLVEDQAWDDALKIFQAILIHHRDGLTDLEVVETYWQIGEILDRLGQKDRAAKSFEKALEIDAGHEPSRRSLVAVLEAQGDFEGAVDHRHKLAAALSGPGKLEVLVAIGQLCRDRLQDPYQAIDAFTAAARIDPGNVAVIEALLGLYRDTRQGQKAADVLARLLETPAVKGDPQRAGRLHHALALTLRDELKDEAGAARELDGALDADPRLVQAFADLEALLAGKQRWRELEQAYVRMIQRLGKGPETSTARLALWKTLGELYRRVLDDTEGARMAYEVVARSDPGDAAAVEAHAELAAKLHGREAEAIAAYRQLLPLSGAPQKPVSALVGLHAELKQYDQAYSAGQALVFLLGAGTPEEGQVVARLRRFARDTASASLDEAGWSRLLHERARGPLAAILALLARDAAEIFVQLPKDLGLNPRKDEVDVAGSMLFFVNMYKYVARTLGLGQPRLIRPSEAGARLAVLPVAPPGLIAGEELFKERPKKELWFTIGKAMAFLRPEMMLARLMPHDQLDAVFQAAASLGTSRFVVTADPHLVERLKRRLEKVLPEPVRTQTLKKLARDYCDVQHPGDVRAYMDACELSSNRVGALLAGDLDVVRRRVSAEPPAVSRLKEETRLRDLILFCTTDDYAALRQQLGLSVVIPNA
jgi:tetratricopeptide (TPR) repeat protein